MPDGSTQHGWSRLELPAGDAYSSISAGSLTLACPTISTRGRRSMSLPICSLRTSVRLRKGREAVGRGHGVKYHHEIRDPLHVFVRLDSDERAILDSGPVQRLRHIHQLGLSYLVYPGATHRRFEHSLGVMELAGRVFDVVTDPENVVDSIREAFTAELSEQRKGYWRRALRVAALCHDIGHLPFSHGAEALLPGDWDHEMLTVRLLLDSEIRDILDGIRPPLDTEDVIKLAVGPKGAKKASRLFTELGELEFSDWEAVMAEVIVGDTFGVDRIDYLLRDSHHAGVGYGHFDHFRLLDTVRVLPATDPALPGASVEPTLGVEAGGIHSAEALLIARYFMYMQVYFHHVRLIYDALLREFFEGWLPRGVFSTEVNEHLQLTDVEVLADVRKISRDADHPAHEVACLLNERNHPKVAYSREEAHMDLHREATSILEQELKSEFPDYRIRRVEGRSRSALDSFPVLTRDGDIQQSSDVLRLVDLPEAVAEHIVVEQDHRSDVKAWIGDHAEDRLRQVASEENESGGAP